MRFRFCGDLDCPDWVLAEMNVLAKLTSVKLKLLVVQVIKTLLGEDADFGKLEKLTSDAKFEHGDVKACVACLRFIITKAAKNDVDDETLSSELQQLGLPKEHAASLCKTYGSKLSTLQEKFRKESFRLSDRLESAQCEITTEKQKTVILKLNLRSEDDDLKETSFEITPEKFHVLLQELKIARNLINEAS